MTATAGVGTATRESSTGPSCRQPNTKPGSLRGSFVSRPWLLIGLLLLRAYLSAPLASESLYLVAAPVAVRGIEVLAPNDFAAHRGYYRFSTERLPVGSEAPLEETADVRVIYTTVDVPVPSEWPAVRVGDFGLRRTENTGVPSVWYSSGDWTIFMTFKQAYPWWEEFVSGFIRGFRFFLSYAAPGEVPFPAVVEVGEPADG